VLKALLWAGLLVWFLRLPEWGPTTLLAVGLLVLVLTLNLGVLVLHAAGQVRIWRQEQLSRHCQ